MPSALAGQRPITDFIDNQGNFPFPGAGTVLGVTDPASNTVMRLDYAGVWNAFFALGLPTTFGGSIDERLLADGSAEVSVILHAHDAFALVYGLSPFGVLLGNFPTSVQQGAQPALGDVTVEIKFINPGGLGAPMPDLIQLLAAPVPGQTTLFFGYVGQATGPTPDGGTGFAQTRQTSLIATALIADPNSRLGLDATPAEKIIIRPIGK
jgi:hypothetical protein